MSDFNIFSYVCDDKFENVVNEMSKRRWHQVGTDEEIPPTCKLLWRNLANINFKSAIGRCVNHFRGSQHMSNKAFLTYHLRVMGQNLLLPPTWSASFEDLPALVLLLINGELVALLDIALEQGIWVDEKNSLFEFSDVLAAIEMDKELTSTSAFKSASTLMKLCDQMAQSSSGGCGWIPCPSKNTGDMLGHLQNLNLCPEWSEWLQNTEALGYLNDPCMHGVENLWILKPVGSSCGEAIRVVRGIRQLLMITREYQYKCIVQKYIERPLLLRGGRKFDIRQWILVSNLNPLTIHGFSECYVRLSAVPLSLDDTLLDSSLVHLCNHAVQKNIALEAEMRSGGDNSSQYESSNDNEIFMCHTMMSQSEFARSLNKRFGNESSCNSGNSTGDVFHTIIKPQIRQITIDTIMSCRDRLSRVGQGFEWLGLDLMVVDNTRDGQGEKHGQGLKVRLIEVNVSPDVSLSTSVTSRLVPVATSTLLDIVLPKNVRDATMDTGAKTEEAEMATELHEDTLKWEMWHCEEYVTDTYLKNQGKKKEKMIAFGSGYGPRKKHVLERVEMVLGMTVGVNEDTGEYEEKKKVDEVSDRVLDQTEIALSTTVVEAEENDSDEEL
jgi:hypothetical protein